MGEGYLPNDKHPIRGEREGVDTNIYFVYTFLKDLK